VTPLDLLWLFLIFPAFSRSSNSASSPRDAHTPSARRRGGVDPRHRDIAGGLAQRGHARSWSMEVDRHGSARVPGCV
jgi:hypothetical protein